MQVWIERLKELDAGTVSQETMIAWIEADGEDVFEASLALVFHKGTPEDVIRHIWAKHGAKRAAIPLQIVQRHSSPADLIYEIHTNENVPESVRAKAYERLLKLDVLHLFE